MKTNNIKSILLAMVGACSIGLVSCDDNDFLTEQPESFYTIDNIFTGQDQVDQVISTCYLRIRHLYCPYNNWAELDTWSYRMGNGTDMFDVAGIRYGYRFNDYSILNPEYGVYRSVFYDFYYLISSANTAIYAAEKDGVAWDSEEKKNAALSEARFFRAFAYRNLAELYGGVPIVKEMASEPRYDYQRATQMETFQFAIDEMEDIEKYIPESNGAGRINKAVVQTNLAQLYLDAGALAEKNGQDGKSYLQKSVEYASKVIDGGRYQLMTERFGSRANEDPEYYYANNASMCTPEHSYTVAGYHIDGNVYWDLFQEGNQDYETGNKEAIWVSQSDYTLYKSEGWDFCLYYPAIYGPVFRDVGGQYLNGNMPDVGGLGMVQVCPTEYARDLIYSDKWEDDMRNSEAAFHRIFLGNQPGTEYYGKEVPWDILYGKEADGKYNDAKYTELYPISVKIGTDKYTGIADGEDYTRLFRDDYLLRLPETILLRAEAYWRMGNASSAADDINKLRKRAKCGYLVTSGDVDADLILDERARELIYEECRWNTLLRFGGNKTRERIQKYSYWDCGKTTPASTTFELWPLPQSVIDTNKDCKLEQNSGW